MYRIKDIKLTNFKFFFGEENLKLDKRHTLIYGENGSGKSSIYWALHCFLHSTLKPDAASVQKYFLPISRSAESIKNRYAQDTEKSGVSITLEHDDVSRYANINAEISDSVVNTQTSPEIKLMTLSSELINYKVIYNMYLATNKSTIKLFSYFEKNLMEFIDFDQDLTTISGNKLSRNSLEWWRYIKDGILPYTTMTDPRYIQFQDHVAIFNRKLNDYLQLITGEANRILNEDFGENFKFKFQYTPAIYNDFKYKNGQPHGRTRETTAPEIELLVILPDLHGAVSEIKRPQSYLNEARLSAIAIAIRLAILKERYIEKAPRIMVLDDLLLSLDLGNRSSLLKVLLKKYAPLYQLIILTHDRVFFDCVLNHLSDEEQKKWCILEMYETEKDNKKVPTVIQYQTALSKAYSYFKGINCSIDYNACGNNQRQALEGLFKKQFETYSLRNKNGELVQTSGLMIADCIANAKSMYSKIGFDTDLLDELEIHRKQSLNPTSHHNPQSNYYKAEIVRTFEIIDLLNEHKIEKLVPSDSIISLDVECNDGTRCSYKVQILDDILVYKKPDSVYFLNMSDKRKYAVKEFNGAGINNVTSAFTLMELYEDTLNGIINYLHKEPIKRDDVLSVFQYEGITIQAILEERNGKI